MLVSVSDGNKIPLIEGAKFSNGEFRFTLNPLGENGEFCASPNMYIDIDNQKALQGAQEKLASLRQSACDPKAQGEVTELEKKVTELERKMTEPKLKEPKTTSPRHTNSNVDTRDVEAWHPKPPAPASQL